MAGDMIVASLIDAGANFEQFQQMLGELHLEGYTIDLEQVRRGGIRAKHFRVNLGHEHPHEHTHTHQHENHEHSHPHKHEHKHAHDHESHQHTHSRAHEHRDLNAIIDIIQRANLPERVKTRAINIFNRLGYAEAHVHGCDISQVHFHEVGAVDAIVDIVGACIALELLDVETLYFSKVAVGSGQVTGSHGVLPIPAPATAKLLEGCVIDSAGRTGELATPTGAAILTTLGEQKVFMPELNLKTIGYGAGTRDDAHHPNVLRVMLAEQSSAGRMQVDEVTSLIFGVDDITGEHLGYLSEQLMSRGALDVAQIPMYMKKGRSAVRVEVLAGAEKVDELIEYILTQGTTFGLRVDRHQRVKLSRDFVAVILPEGKIRVKLGMFDGKVVQIAPEYDDCRNAAERSGKNFRDIYLRASEQARQEIEKS
jgi:uncharacterized protein (TIGR00299 family) protein